MEEYCIDEKCALTAILQSISMQETALAQILNSEAEKLKKVICMTNCIEELLEVNESVQQTVNTVAQLECCLKEKAIYAMESLKELRHKPCCSK